MKRTSQFKANYGFTLVEAMVTVGVLSVIALAFLPSFGTSIRRKALSQSLENARDAISTARNKALTQISNPGEENPYRYSGVRFVYNSSRYEFFRSKEANKDVCRDLESHPNVVIDSSKNFPNNVVAKIPSSQSPTCFFFEFGSGNTFVSKGDGSCVPCAN